MAHPTVGGRGFLREEGFTLSEVLATTCIMIVVLFALYGMFDAGIRVFASGSDKVEAVENARLGLERMEREIRGAYPYDLTTDSDPDTEPDPDLFYSPSAPGEGTMPVAARITFGNDLNGNHQIDAAPGRAGEVITYATNARNELVRTQGNQTQPVAGPLAPTPGRPGVRPGLRFTYLGSNGEPCGGANLTCGAADHARVQAVRIALTVDADGTTQTLTTDVDLRNR